MGYAETAWFYSKVLFFVIVTTFSVFNHPYTLYGLFSLTELFLRSFDQPVGTTEYYDLIKIGVFILNLATMPLVMYNLVPMDTFMFLMCIMLMWVFGTRLNFLLELFKK